jgi:hypothetical protein
MLNKNLKVGTTSKFVIKTQKASKPRINSVVGSRSSCRFLELTTFTWRPQTDVCNLS